MTEEMLSDELADMNDNEKDIVDVVLRTPLVKNFLVEDELAAHVDFATPHAGE